MVHVFKYLDTVALKEEKTRNGSFDGHTTLRRNAAAKNCSGPLSELQKIRRQNVDSGYSTSDGYDKRWSQELAPNSNSNGAATTVTDNGNPSKWSPTQSQHLSSGSEKSSPLATTYPQFQSHASGNSTPTNLSSPVETLQHSSNNNNSSANIIVNSNHQIIDEHIKPSTLIDSSTPKRTNLNGSNNNNRYVFGHLLPDNKTTSRIHPFYCIKIHSAHFIHQFNTHISFAIYDYIQLHTQFYHSFSFDVLFYKSSTPSQFAKRSARVNIHLF